MLLSKYKFSAGLDRPINSCGYPKEIQVLKDYIDEKKGNIVLINESELIFKGGYSPWRGNICKFIKEGKFNIREKNQKLFLEYRIQIDKLIIYIRLFGIGLGIFLDWKVSVPFVWVGGMNWILAIIRNNSMVDNIAGEINQLLKNKK
ncbi:hypothetical protein [Mucilaginibacter arboris]|uniref:Uncharacterized protein n=1 Tax=Mucilaginibacter arboris TaxID=2682090 RepID=A0A7K1T1T1_9SPHI|nr:hypothetical protein [Mucilaginibacter arboris]MVN23515.1 hypothetical protein [Mucilaginibacter arboris]